MKKSEAIHLLGGTVTSAAIACEITPSAVSQWPDDLTKDQIVRVQAALYRMGQRRADKRKPKQVEKAT